MLLLRPIFRQDRATPFFLCLSLVCVCAPVCVCVDMRTMQQWLQHTHKSSARIGVDTLHLSHIKIKDRVKEPKRPHIYVPASLTDYYTSSNSNRVESGLYHKLYIP